MYPAKDIAALLDVGASTLRRWSNDFEAYLSPTARKALTERGQPAQRRYTDADLALLLAIQRAIADGVPVREVQDQLARGDLVPVPDVVVRNMLESAPDAPMSGVVAPDAPMSASGALVALGYAGADVAGALVALSAALPTMSEALASVERASAALADATARQEAALRAQQYLVEELRQERAALAALRAEAAQARHHPKVLPGSPGLGARVRRWFTGGGSQGSID